MSTLELFVAHTHTHILGSSILFVAEVADLFLFSLALLRSPWCHRRRSTVSVINVSHFILTGITDSHWFSLIVQLWLMLMVSSFCFPEILIVLQKKWPYHMGNALRHLNTKTNVVLGLLGEKVKVLFYNLPPDDIKCVMTYLKFKFLFPLHCLRSSESNCDFMVGVNISSNPSRFIQQLNSTGF